MVGLNSARSSFTYIVAVVMLILIDFDCRNGFLKVENTTLQVRLCSLSEWVFESEVELELESFKTQGYQR